MTLTEAVARAMLGRNPYSAHTQRAIALEVLTTLKANVTPAMIEEGADSHNGIRYAGKTMAGEVFRAMLDAAIKEIEVMK